MSKSYHQNQTPQFKEDFRQALYHIAVELGNPIAADALTEEFARASEQVLLFPRSMPPWPTRRDRPEIYRSVAVKNYLAFYVILDDTVEFRRFLYASADLPAQLTS